METITYSPSFFLFARPSLWAGFGQLLDFGNTMFVFNESVNGEQADFFATKGDWVATGVDLRRALEEAGISLDELEAAAPKHR